VTHKPQNPIDVAKQLKRELLSARSNLQRALSNQALSMMHASGQPISTAAADEAKLKSLRDESALFNELVSQYTNAPGAPARDAVLGNPAVIKSLIQAYVKRTTGLSAPAAEVAAPDIADQQDPRYVPADVPTGDAAVSFQRKRGLQLFQTSEPANGMPQFGRGSLFPTMSPSTEKAEMEMPEVEDGNVVMPPRVVPSADAASARIQRLEAKVDKLTQLVSSLVSAQRGRR
jgi:hypothetical protein